MLACKLLLLGLLAVCSVSALSKELVTDVDAHRTKVRHSCWAWWEGQPHWTTLLHLPTILNRPSSPLLETGTLSTHWCMH